MNKQTLGSESSQVVIIYNDKLEILSFSSSLFSIFNLKCNSEEIANIDSLFDYCLIQFDKVGIEKTNFFDFCLSAFQNQSHKFEFNLDRLSVQIETLPLNLMQNSSQSAALVIKEYTKERNHLLQLRKQVQELLDANNTKDKFFSIIAHDLKNPLSTFKQVTEILYEEIDNIDIEEIKEYIFDLKNSALNSLTLLENLLEWAGIQRGKIKYSPAENYLQMIVVNTLALLEMKAEQKNINLFSDIAEELKVYCDANMVMTIVRNLCSNALKFTPEGGSIKVSAAINGKNCTVCIEDSGVGIKAEDIEKLFRIDVHHSTIGTSSEDGTGLGLILCKEFAEIHDGKIWVESEVGKGSKFFFNLPLV